MIQTFLLKMIATKAAKVLIIKILEVLAKRSDNEVDDAIVEVIKEVLDGKTDSIKKSALKK